MFKRAHHRDVALVLQALDAQALSMRHCYFGGGTAMALRYGEYRESVDIDFLVSDLEGYRELRHALQGGDGLQPIVRQGMQLDLARDVRADQYGIRTLVHSGESTIKFEIVFEARIALAAPSGDRICGIDTLAPIDMAAEKLLANADRWRDDAVYSRDIIDLAMQHADAKLLEEACLKAEAGVYGQSVRSALAQAVDMLQNRTGRLDQCMKALAMTTVNQAQLWQAIRRVARLLLA